MLSHRSERGEFWRVARSAAVSRDSQQRWHDLFVPEVHLPCTPWRWRRNRCDQPLQRGGHPDIGQPLRWVISMPLGRGG